MRIKKCLARISQFVFKLSSHRNVGQGADYRVNIISINDPVTGRLFIVVKRQLSMHNVLSPLFAESLDDQLREMVLSFELKII